MSTQSARSPRFKVGDIARSINSKWPVLNHRLVEITEIAAVPRYLHSADQQKVLEVQP